MSKRELLKKFIDDRPVSGGEIDTLKAAGLITVTPSGFIITTAGRLLLNSPVLPPNDMVNHPPHYKQGDIECIDAIKAALTDEEYRGYCKGNALKYIWRERHKGGSESLAKANWYLDRMVKA